LRDFVLDSAKFDEKGLVTAVAQDADTGEVLMLAYMNRESLEMTLSTGIMTYWSRSRNKLWIKGETSGHTQQVVEARIDCDGDALLFKVQQKGGACHTGYRSCFYRKTTKSGLVEDGAKVFEAGNVYKK
jgi:phosphoribosyl-AMP cyclohydrolase